MMIVLKVCQERVVDLEREKKEIGAKKKFEKWQKTLLKCQMMIWKF